MKDEKIIKELYRLAKDNGGELRPGDVVKAARPKSSPLHKCFQWDDSKAAQAYRLWQARQLIRVTVEYIGPDDAAVPMRVFVSLTSDRKNKGGGYRTTLDVMSNRKQREQLLADALAEMELFEEKYSALKELAEVIGAMRSARKKVAA